MFGEGKYAKPLMIKYIIVNTPSSYNIMLGTLVSTMYLKVIYPTDERRLMGVVKVDQCVTRKCFEGSCKSEKYVSTTKQV